MPRHERLPAYRVLSHLVVMVAVSAVLGVVVAGLAIPFAGMAGIGARNVARTMDNLPEELETADDPLPQRTTILDANGNRLASLYDENRITVPLKGISRTMVKALVAIEDYRFYQHGALDLKGTLRALITNQANDGVVQGGSSITQQLVKLTLLSQAKTKAEKRGRDRRHLRPQAQGAALRDRAGAEPLQGLDPRALPQHRLLRRRRVRRPGGGQALLQRQRPRPQPAPVRAAGRAGEEPLRLRPDQVPRPARLERRDVVLDRMAELNVVPRDKAEKNKQKDLGLNVQDVDNGCVNSRAPFFCDYVMAYLLQDPQLGATVQERKNVLKNGGLTIKTTIDMAAQQAADNAVSGTRRTPPTGRSARWRSIEPGTGNVLALAQSRPMGNRKKQGQTYLNFTVPKEYGGANGFQPGSTFKVFTLAAALEQGLPLTTQFNSPSPMTFDQADFSNCPGEGTFGGDYPRRQLHHQRQDEHVLRHPAVGEHLLPPARAADRRLRALRAGQRDGRAAHRPAGRARTPSFTLGIADACPLEMAEAYATFAARGHALRLAAGDRDPSTRPATCSRTTTPRAPR